MEEFHKYTTVTVFVVSTTIELFSGCYEVQRKVTSTTLGIIIILIHSPRIFPTWATENLSRQTSQDQQIKYISCGYGFNTTLELACFSLLFPIAPLRKSLVNSAVELIQNILKYTLGTKAHIQAQVTLGEIHSQVS